MLDLFSRTMIFLFMGVTGKKMYMGLANMLHYRS